MVDENLLTDFKNVCKKSGTDFSNVLKQFCSNCIENDGFPFEIDVTADGQESSLKRTMFWTSQDAKVQFEAICQRMDVSVSTVLRKFMTKCVEEDNINY